MKNIKIFVALFTLLVLASACAPKESKLECTQTTSGVDVGFNVDFKGNMISDINITYDMDLSKYNDAQVKAIGKQDYCKIVKKAMSEYEKGFNNCTQNVENKKLNVKANIDINKINKKVLGNMQKPDDAKKEIEDQGYKCTLTEK